MAATDDSANEEPGGPLGAGGVKALKIAIVVMSVMIVVGLLAIIARIVYLAQNPRPPTTQAAPSATSARPAGASGELRLPAGAVVRHLSLAGDRIAIHYESPAGSGIAVVDAVSGLTLSRIDLKPEPPR